MRTTKCTLTALSMVTFAAPLSAAVQATNPTALSVGVSATLQPHMIVSCIRADGGRERNCEDRNVFENRENNRPSEREEALRERGAHENNKGDRDDDLRRVNRALEELRSVFD